MKHIQFLKHYTPHAKGEIASFSEAIANQLIKAGVAIEHVIEEATPKKGEKANKKVGE